MGRLCAWVIGREARVLRTTVAATSMFVLLAGCGSDNGAAPTSMPEEQSPTASPAASPEAASRLEGTWVTGRVSERDIERTLRKHGLAKWIQRFRPVAPIAADTVLILKIDEGTWDLYGKSKGAPREEIDYDADYELDGDTVVVSHEGESNTYRWSVDDDTLRLTWLDTTYGGYKGIPEEVFQRALYMTEEFVR